MPTPTLNTGCALCGKCSGLLRCGKCRVIQYCSQDHQRQHWISHKKACNSIAREHRTTDAAKSKLPQNIFETSAGQFYELPRTMPYMLARYKFVGALREIDTRLSVQTQKHHLMEMLRLSGFDNMDLRPLVPGTILRLGQEQECYDFMKRTQTALNGPDFMVDASKPPWASIQGCNSFEPLASFCSGGEIELPFKVGLTLVKIRLLLDLLALRAAKAIAIPQSIPPEILTSIRAYVLRTKIVADKHKDKSLLSEDRADETASLKRDIETLWAQVREEHKQMWQMLLHPARHLDTPPVDDQEQPQLSLLFTHKAYEETPYALDVIRRLEKRATT